ncbi:hypothetical protein [Embleya scabrispora]|uniref:hypothetical protein n=1 Tax=Embleya scabrispora TaxID=159449 RepID=UPI0013751EA2|nr:hypothetical protein [Embleya scabrispora]
MSHCPTARGLVERNRGIGAKRDVHTAGNELHVARNTVVGEAGTGNVDSGGGLRAKARP